MGKLNNHDNTDLGRRDWPTAKLSIVPTIHSSDQEPKKKDKREGKAKVEAKLLRTSGPKA